VVNKPEAQEEWAYQGEYRLWSKRCASFNLPLWGRRIKESGSALPFWQKNGKKSHRI
jgi:hypothetical protein